MICILTKTINLDPSLSFTGDLKTQATFRAGIRGELLSTLWTILYIHLQLLRIGTDVKNVLIFNILSWFCDITNPIILNIPKYDNNLLPKEGWNRGWKATHKQGVLSFVFSRSLFSPRFYILKRAPVLE